MSHDRETFFEERSALTVAIRAEDPTKPSNDSVVPASKDRPDRKLLKRIPSELPAVSFPVPMRRDKRGETRGACQTDVAVAEIVSSIRKRLDVPLRCFCAISP